MKIGTITFHAAFNYGSMLQAWALQTYLGKIGHNVEIIHLHTDKQKRMYPSLFNIFSIVSLKRLLKFLFTSPTSIIPYARKWNRFNDFMHRWMKLTKEYKTLNELKSENWNYDLVITGSDQIWNTNASDFNEAYFATFLPDSIKRIAYAPSMGPNPEALDPEYVKQLLRNFLSISVREQRTADFLITRHIVDNVDVVLDPTFLLDAQDYDSLIDIKPLVEGEYIYYYTPGEFRPDFIRLAKFVSEKYQLPIICDGIYTLKESTQFKYYKTAGPSEFLNLIKNAKIVCGASFHLMVFSILFKKNFYCINGDVDSRMNNLMKIFNLENRILSVSKNIDLNNDEIDYKSVDQKMNTYIESSKAYLQQNIGCDTF